MMVRWHPEALAEAKGAAGFYRDKQAGLDRRFLDSLEDVLRRIQRHPNSFRAIGDNLRKCRLPRRHASATFAELLGAKNEVT